MQFGECLCCEKVSKCGQTSVDKVLNGYTCALFSPVPEAEYRARRDAMDRFGDYIAVDALLNQE